MPRNMPAFLRIDNDIKEGLLKVQQLIKEVTRRNDDNDYARQLKSYIAQDRIGKSQPVPF